MDAIDLSLTLTLIDLALTPTPTLLEQVQRDTMICAEQLKRLEEEKKKHPAKLAELARLNKDLDQQIRDAEDGEWTMLNGSPRKGPRTSRGGAGNELGESGLAAVLSGFEAEDLEMCCQVRSCLCGYELRCMRPMPVELGEEYEEYDLDRLDHVPPGQKA